MTKLTVLTPADKLAEIRRLYFATRRETIDADLARAVQLLKSMNTEDEQERARVYMDGLAQMRSDWARSPKPAKSGNPGKPEKRGKPGRPGGKSPRRG